MTARNAHGYDGTRPNLPASGPPRPTSLNLPYGEKQLYPTGAQNRDPSNQNAQQQRPMQGPVRGAPAYLKQFSIPKSPNRGRETAPMVPGYSYQVSSKPYRPVVDREGGTESVGQPNVGQPNVGQKGVQQQQYGAYNLNRGADNFNARAQAPPPPPPKSGDKFGSIPDYLCNLPEMNRWSMSFSEKHRSVGILEMRSPDMVQNRQKVDSKRHSVGYFEEGRLMQKLDNFGFGKQQRLSQQQTNTFASIEQLRKSMEDLVNTIADSKQNLPGKTDQNPKFRESISDSVLPRKPPSPLEAGRYGKVPDLSRVTGKHLEDLSSLYLICLLLYLTWAHNFIYSFSSLLVFSFIYYIMPGIK